MHASSSLDKVLDTGIYEFDHTKSATEISTANDTRSSIIYWRTSPVRPNTFVKLEGCDCGKELYHNHNHHPAMQ
jgi:hypothetical protein